MSGIPQNSHIEQCFKNHVPNSLQVLGKHYHPHFVNGETELHKSWVMCLQPNSQMMPSTPKSKKLSPRPLHLDPGQLSPHHYIMTYHDVTSTQESILPKRLSEETKWEPHLV